MPRMLTAAGLLLAATALTAQAPVPLKPGDQIPDLALTGATRGGVLQRLRAGAGWSGRLRLWA